MVERCFRKAEVVGSIPTFGSFMTKYSRLSKIEEKRNIWQAVLYLGLSLVLLTIIIGIGIPFLIKMVVFVSDLKSSGQKIETTQTSVPPAPVLETRPEATNSASIKVSGYSQKDNIIKLYLNDLSIKETTADKEGQFTFTNILLKEGANKISVKAITGNSSESDFSNELNIFYSNEKPKLEITSPQKDAKFFDKDKEIKVEGITDPYNTIYVNSRLGKANSEGKFSILISLQDGDNTIKVIAKNQAGSETLQEIKVTYSP